MFRVKRSPKLELEDTSRFIERLNRLSEHPHRIVSNLFDNDGDVFVARAPGRLDLMGGIADYSGSLVLQMPIAEATFAAVQIDIERKLTIVSLSENQSQHDPFEIDLSKFETGVDPISYEAARALMSTADSMSWAAYVAGAVLVLMIERGVRFQTGARILIGSDVPEGKGVSSSAAIEVASMSALAVAFDIRLAPEEIGQLCQIVENKVVGAPCGVMDQMTAACGSQGKLLSLLCQPALLLPSVAIPDELGVWGIDSGIRHSVGGGDYGSVRCGAFMGLRIIESLSLDNDESLKRRYGTRSESDRKYLANLTPSLFITKFASQLPEEISGAEFLSKYQGTSDPVTKVEPNRTYKVLKPTQHPVYEHFRVRTFAELMSAHDSDRRNEQLGELMYQSHASYSACGLGSTGTDTLVDLVRTFGSRLGLYGAKITGGGSGGTVAILGHKEAAVGVAEIAAKYRDMTGQSPKIFSGSTPGSGDFGTLILTPVS